MASSINAGFIFPVSISISTNTGTPFAISTDEAVAIKVYAGTITSSPAFTPAAFKATHKADVPELVDMLYFAS